MVNIIVAFIAGVGCLPNFTTGQVNAGRGFFSFCGRYLTQKHGRSACELSPKMNVLRIIALILSSHSLYGKNAQNSRKYRSHFQKLTPFYVIQSLSSNRHSLVAGRVLCAGLMSPKLLPGARDP